MTVLTPLSNKDKIYNPYEIGSPVVCLFIGDSLERGFIIGTFFSQKNSIPDGANKNKRIMEYPGGVKIEIDKELGKMDVLGINNINIKAKEINLEGENVKITGEVEIENLIVKKNTKTMGTTITEGVRVL